MGGRVEICHVRENILRLISNGLLCGGDMEVDPSVDIIGSAHQFADYVVPNSFDRYNKAEFNWRDVRRTATDKSLCLIGSDIEGCHNMFFG